MTKKQKKQLVRILLAAVGLAALRVADPWLIPTGVWGVVRLVLYLADYLFVGYASLRKAEGPAEVPDL